MHPTLLALCEHTEGIPLKEITTLRETTELLVELRALWEKRSELSDETLLWLLVTWETHLTQEDAPLFFMLFLAPETHGDLLWEQALYLLSLAIERSDGSLLNQAQQAIQHAFIQKRKTPYALLFELFTQGDRGPYLSWMYTPLQDPTFPHAVTLARLFARWREVGALPALEARSTEEKDEYILLDLLHYKKALEEKTPAHPEDALPFHARRKSWNLYYPERAEAFIQIDLSQL